MPRISIPADDRDCPHTCPLGGGAGAVGRPVGNPSWRSLMRSVLRSLLLLVLVAGCSRSGHMLQSPRIGAAAPSAIAADNIISGVVLNSSSGNAPVGGIVVTAIPYDTTTSLPFEYTAGHDGFYGITDATGHYSIPGL